MSVKSIPSDIRMIAAPTVSKPVTLPVDGASSGHASYVAPTGFYIRGVNISVAGILKLLNVDGSTGQEYFNTGWNVCTLSTQIVDDTGNTATVLKVATTATSVNV